MAKDLKNKVVVITGAAMGIGRGIADHFLLNGAKIIVILDTNEIEGSKTVKMLDSKHGKNRCAYIKCDVTRDLEDVFVKIIDTYKYVDVLVNNAGILDELTPQNSINTNFTALVEWSLKFWHYMRLDNGGKGGTIFNVASIYGYRVDPFVPVYHGTKFAVIGFTRSLGHSYNFNKSGVRVIAINPGFTRTTMESFPKILMDEHRLEDLFKLWEVEKWQDVDAVGSAAVDIFRKAESGSTWTVEDSKPAVEVQFSYKFSDDL